MHAVKLLNHDLPLSSSWSQINNLSIEKCWQMLNHQHVSHIADSMHTHTYTQNQEPCQFPEEELSVQ